MGYLGACSFSSDTNKINLKTNIPLNDDSGVATSGSGSGTWSFDLDYLAGNSNFVDSITILIPEQGTGKTNSLYTLTVLQSGSVIFQDTAAAQIDFRQIFLFNKNLLGLGQYEFQISSTDPIMSLFTPTSFPYIEGTGLIKASNPELNGQAVDRIPYVILKTKSSIGIEEDDLSLNIYPNPASDFIFIESDSPYELELYNQSGKLLITEMLSGGKISTEGISDGVYILKLTNQKHSIRKKVVIARWDSLAKRILL